MYNKSLFAQVSICARMIIKVRLFWDIVLWIYSLSIYLILNSAP